MKRGLSAAAIARLLCEEYAFRGLSWSSEFGRAIWVKHQQRDYLAFIKTIANGSSRNSTVQKGYALACKMIERGA